MPEAVAEALEVLEGSGEEKRKREKRREKTGKEKRENGKREKRKGR